MAAARAATTSHGGSWRVPACPSWVNAVTTVTAIAIVIVTVIVILAVVVIVIVTVTVVVVVVVVLVLVLVIVHLIACPSWVNEMDIISKLLSYISIIYVILRIKYKY